MVRVTISETYDLSTKQNKMSMVGIHTPRIEILKKTYGGIIQNARFYRYTKCDVRLACASVLPADPLQVGVESGDIAPQDMFNPILYKATSNEGMNMFELRMRGLLDGTSADDTLFQGQSIAKTDDVTGSPDEFAIYYGLLSNRKGWKVAHPQAGLRMAGLRPYVYEKLYDTGDKPTATDGLYSVPSGSSSDDIVMTLFDKEDTKSIQARISEVRSLRGRPRPLPPLPTSTCLVPNASADGTSAYSSGTLYEKPDFKDMLIYCGLIILPPAKLNKFYYRLVVRWTVDFFGIRPLTDIATFGTIGNNAVAVHYGSDYFPLSKNVSDSLGMIDVKDADAEKVMEGI